MADIRVKIAGLEYENPVIVAAGTTFKGCRSMQSMC